jgi:hypothetical protein
MKLTQAWLLSQAFCSYGCHEVWLYSLLAVCLFDTEIVNQKLKLVSYFNNNL